VIGDVNAEAADAVVASVAGRSNPPIALALDVTSRASIEAMVKEVLDRFSRIDILVNSAGTAFREKAEDFPEEVWDRVIGLNLKGTFLSCQTVGRQMLKQKKGSIINLASIGASVAYPMRPRTFRAKAVWHR